MMIFAFTSGVLTGLALGIFGSGGGIIVVPALIYLLHLPPKEAIAMGLGIIAITATSAACGGGRPTTTMTMRPMTVAISGCGRISAIAMSIPAAPTITASIERRA